MGLFGSNISIDHFIRRAHHHGLPTEFLTHVAKNYTLRSSGASRADHVWLGFDRLYLSDETRESVRGMSYDLPSGEAVGIQTIYHEATHAYVDLKQSEDVKVAAMVERGEEHYRDTLLDDGSEVDDEYRVLQEACASYVGHRASSFWMAGEKLTLLQRSLTSPHVELAELARLVEQVPATYNRAMAMRVFGYQDRGWLSKRQVSSQAPISVEWRSYCDSVILEGAIPDQFKAAKRLVPLYWVLCQRVREIPCIY